MNDRLTFTGSVAVEGRRLKGSVLIAGQQTPKNGERVEVDLDALFRADRSGAVMVVGHQAFSEGGYDPLRTVARLDNGSLRITPTNVGFDYETDELPNTTYANDALELARTGVFGGTSFDVFGLRSQVRVEPGNIRVRRYTSIAKFGAVTPVVDPAFPSSIAAFSKETDVADEAITEAPDTEAPPAKREPATFNKGGETAELPKSGKEYWAEFAKDLSLEMIEGTMDQLFSAAKGDLRDDALDRYEGFASELQTRKRVDTRARARIEALQFEHNARLGRVPHAPEADELFASKDYEEAFGRYLGGDMTVMGQFAQSIAGDGTQGGYAVPDGFLDRLTTRRKAFGGVEAHADVITTGDGTSLRWPSNDDTGNTAAIAAEGAAGAAGADLVLGNLELGSFSFDANGASNLPVKVSKELIQDSRVDFAGRVADALGMRLGRKMAAAFATGVGTTEPFGLFSKTPDAMTATTAYAAFVEQFFQVDQWYRDNAIWLMSDTTLSKVFNSVDDEGRPLFTPAAAAGGQSAPSGFILGKPVHLDQGAGSLVAFGDIGLGYIVRHVQGITIDVDPYSYISTRQIGYHAWARADANIQDTFAVSVSTFASVTADAE